MSVRAESRTNLGFDFVYFSTPLEMTKANLNDNSFEPNHRELIKRKEFEKE